MIDSGHVLELTAGYALGALPPSLASAVEAHCTECSACSADLAEMVGLAATLPLACEQVAPALDLKRRILAEARGDVSAGQVLRHPARRAVALPPVWWAAAAAAAILVAGSLGAGAMLDRQRTASEMASMKEQVAADQGALDEIAGAARVWDMSGGTRQHWWHCMLVQPSSAKPAMLVALMPAAPKGMTFQAWVIRKGAIHNAGTLPAGVKSMMHLPMSVQRGDVVAFSIEPMGGSASPTTPFAMQQTLD
jgi:anti-sigma-K factor RskA